MSLELWSCRDNCRSTRGVHDSRQPQLDECKNYFNVSALLRLTVEELLLHYVEKRGP